MARLPNMGAAKFLAVKRRAAAGLRIRSVE